MNYIIGKVYPFKDNTWGRLYPWVVKKVIGFDSRGYAKTVFIGACFIEKDDAIEYCHWWNYKYVEKGNKDND